MPSVRQLTSGRLIDCLGRSEEVWCRWENRRPRWKEAYLCEDEPEASERRPKSVRKSPETGCRRVYGAVGPLPRGAEYVRAIGNLDRNLKMIRHPALREDSHPAKIFVFAQDLNKPFPFQITKEELPLNHSRNTMIETHRPIRRNLETRLPEPLESSASFPCQLIACHFLSKFPTLRGKSRSGAGIPSIGRGARASVEFTAGL